MARITEKRLYAVLPQNITADGTADGGIKVKNTALFTVGQIVYVKSNTVTPTEFKIKRIEDGKQMYLGQVKAPIQDRSDMSILLLVDSPIIYANEQQRPSVPEQEIERLTYEEEPVIARRVIGVNRFGATLNGDQDGVTPTEWDDVQLTRDIDGDITQAEFFLDSQSITNLELTYDIDKNLIRVRKI